MQLICAHTRSQESVKRKKCLLFVFLSLYLFFIFPPLWAQLRACSFLIIQKRTVWNMLSSPVRKMQVENNAGSLRCGLGNKINQANVLLCSDFGSSDWIPVILNDEKSLLFVKRMLPLPVILKEIA